MANIQYYISSFMVLIFCSDVLAINYEKCPVKLINNTGHIMYECLSEDEETEETKLRLVSMLFRYGDRIADVVLGEQYPNDPHRNDSYYPDGNGLLTKVGKRRAYELGNFLRKRYGSFLGDIYYPPNVYARSTESIKTKMTLQLVLTGLYPPVDFRQKWHSKLAWQPFDIKYAPYREDGLLFPFICSKYKKIHKQILQTQSVQDQLKSFVKIMPWMSNATGKSINTVEDFAALHQLFQIYSSMDKSLPHWAQDVNISIALYNATILTYNLTSPSKEIHKFNGGTLLYRILKDMKKVIIGTSSDRKINLYSGHDVNIVAILLALGIYDYTIPEFTSGVIVELREKKNTYFVQILRYLGFSQIPVKIKLPNCDELCPYDRYVQLTQDVTGTDDLECPLTIGD